MTPTLPSPASPRCMNTRWCLPLLALLAAALACNMPRGTSTDVPPGDNGLAAAQALYDEAGVSLEEALTASPVDERTHVLELLGPPDAFTLEWQDLEGTQVRWEEWSYFDFHSRFDFVDGELLWTLDIDPAPDGSIYAHAFDPLAFQAGIRRADVEAILPFGDLTELPLDEADVPGGLLLAGDQILLGFDQDELVYVQTFILAPEEPLAYSAPSQPPAGPASVPTPGDGAVLLFDGFDDPSQTAMPLFEAEYMEFSLEAGTATMTAHDPGVLVATYPSPQLSDFAATLRLWAPNPQPGGGYGMIFRADDAAGGLSHYYLLLALPADGLLRLQRYDGGQLTSVQEAPLPAVTGQPFTLTVTAEGESINVEVDGEWVFLVVDRAIPGPGIFGLAMVTPKAGDIALFDALQVEALNE